MNANAQNVALLKLVLQNNCTIFDDNLLRDSDVFLSLVGTGAYRLFLVNIGIIPFWI